MNENQHTARTMNPINVIETRGLSKQYPGTAALVDVDYKVRRGKVNVLIGENGAGKSTLMKLLAGAETPTSGEIWIDEKLAQITDVRSAEQHGIGIIFQELNLFPDMTVAENIFAGNEITNSGVIRSKMENHQAKVLLDRLNIAIDPRTRLGDLYVGQQQLVEIAKALSKHIKVLIMDEPTSALSKTEVEILFKIIGQLKEEGVTVIYISHRLEEIMAIGDCITVLRNGRLVAENDIANIDIPWIIEAMVGSSKKRFAFEQHEIGREVLKVKDLALKRSNGIYAVDHVSFTARAGEVIGIYGLMGAGRTELLESLLGANPLALGEIELAGKAIEDLPIPKRIEAGIALVPEDRQKQGMVQLMTILENMTLSSLGKFTRRFVGALTRDKQVEAANDIVKKLAIKAASVDAPITSLSGGNMQKVVIGKALLTKPKVLLMDEPTRGIDVGAKEDVYKTISLLARSGIAVIYATSELDEAMAVSNRVFVMASGKLTAVLDRPQFDSERIVRASTPATAVV
ncbi:MULTISPECIES: sugar ABC transporter ATP-binding protein [unclassified Caballeronia]|uniref:sugar ABC transporter ATP-binding protein n=1 Tax=unclassified Caballeronia TaxID=2646786 RepID=UPI0015882ACF|nr:MULTISPECIES: sugar ABC transporter ATP-binding protein [unclassified Caballeronia]QSN64512.1 sugar ABC transporter ATP-binding protein [Caballeronia sp. M1242]